MIRKKNTILSHKGRMKHNYFYFTANILKGKGIVILSAAPPSFFHTVVHYIVVKPTIMASSLNKSKKFKNKL